MANDMLEILKTISAASVVFAAIFLIWDYYANHFPVALILARPIIPGSANMVPFLLVKNVSDRPILIMWKSVDSTHLRVAKDHSTPGIVESTIQDQTTVSLGAETELFLPVIRPVNYDEMDADKSMQIVVRWRFAQPLLWKPDRKISLSVRKRDLDCMVDNFVQPTDESGTDWKRIYRRKADLHPRGI